MEGLNLDTTQLVALAAALGWASGLRLYAVLFLNGLAGALGWVVLPAGLQVLQQSLLLGASGFMLAVEFFADKIPGLDSLWDLVHTLIFAALAAALALMAVSIALLMKFLQALWMRVRGRLPFPA